MTIGVLALQGDFALHRQALDRVGAESREVRKPAELDLVAVLIIPGGESTTLLKLMDAWQFVPALEKFQAGKPIFGTCAGLILLAREVESQSQFSLCFIDITAERNAEVRRVMVDQYGRERWLRDSGAKATHEDETGVLYHTDGGAAMVGVVNSTPEPDGSRRRYFLS